MAGVGSPAAILDVDGVLVEKSLGIKFTAHRFADAYPYKDGIEQARAQFEAGEVGYAAMAAEVVRHWRDGLQGMAADAVQDDAAAFAAEYPVLDAGEALLTRLAAAGFDIYLVSINPVEVLDPFADRLAVAVAGVYGTALSVDSDGRYDGGVARDLVTGERSKADVAPEIFAQSAQSGSVAVGDTVTDLPLFRRVETGVLIMPEGARLDRLRDDGEPWSITGSTTVR